MSAGAPACRPPLVTVVVPALDEAHALPEVLDHLAGLRGRWQVIVVDGGSCDGTPAIARTHRSRPAVLEARGGRAAQQNAGAAAAAGELLVFLHADSRLPPDAYASLTAAAAAGCIGGNFRLRFEGDDAFARMLGAAYALQRRFGFYYGDSSIWVRREVFARLGGFRALAVMDDYDFVRRLERLGKTACLPGPAITSARRWRRLGIPRTLLSWYAIRALYVLGVPAERLARLYRPVR